MANVLSNNFLFTHPADMEQHYCSFGRCLCPPDEVQYSKSYWAGLVYWVEKKLLWQERRLRLNLNSKVSRLKMKKMS